MDKGVIFTLMETAMKVPGRMINKCLTIFIIIGIFHQKADIFELIIFSLFCSNND